jgi:hypothetical protein
LRAYWLVTCSAINPCWWIRESDRGQRSLDEISLVCQLFARLLPSSPSPRVLYIRTHFPLNCRPPPSRSKQSCTCYRSRQRKLEQNSSGGILVITREMIKNIVAAAVALAALATVFVCTPAAAAERRRWVEEGGAVRREVTLDSRALVVDGARRVLFAGEMHYTRSTPEVSVARRTSPYFFSSLLAIYLCAMRMSMPSCYDHSPSGHELLPFDQHNCRKKGCFLCLPPV